ncbi:MAG: mechanosensitive ion channel [Candidatus Manganitrophus sp.]|nr:mechanosensitive ion channel [Candidatus Manganitrophus sp.]MDC4223008.1 mechanosensitive ion channel [Candidatus Manganitrophus sp.]WDT71364.1 MAG: mechanosensitive ion channel [Candidatus Manganitrophus sp.]WDT81311.1 MAG: mechanosensitive ion channel [Candidatus Manganitrophus sp.]
MENFIRLVGPNRAVEIFGVKLVGVNAENAKKLLFSLLFIALIVLMVRSFTILARWWLHGRGKEQVEFWARQGIRLAAAVILILGLASIWFDDPGRLATGLGLITAALAFALQKVVTAIAGYFVILRGKVFNVGDRIRMGGVRGDVLGLTFTQTTIMEMGQPPPVQGDEPAMWVQSRQYTGRVVTVSNAKIFEEPVFNYTRDFPFLWEEMVVPITYDADRARAERILLDAAERHTVSIGEMGREALEEMKRRYFMKSADMRPKVYFRLTDNWLEMTVRFIARDYGVRELKDAMSRDILKAFDEARIGVASATFEIVGLPPLRIQQLPRRAEETPGKKEAA